MYRRRAGKYGKTPGFPDHTEMSYRRRQVPAVDGLLICLATRAIAYHRHETGGGRGVTDRWREQHLRQIFDARVEDRHAIRQSLALTVFFITALIAAIFYLAATQGIEAEEMLVARAAEAPSQP
jgi:hypothetical protein